MFSFFFSCKSNKLHKYDIKHDDDDDVTTANESKMFFLVLLMELFVCFE